MIRKILLTALLWPLVSLAQTFTYPSVTFQNLTVLGTTNVGSVNLGAQAANTVLANVTGSSASPTAVAVPSCNTASSALLWTSGSGFSCNTSINAATLGGVSAGSYAPVASPIFTGTVTIPSGASIAGYAPLVSPAMTGTPTAPTATTGTNTTQLATTAYVAKHELCPSVIDYGGDPTGANDNSTALTNALAASPSGHACAYFGPGTWKFTSGYSYTVPSSGSVSLFAAGSDVTYLSWPTNGGLTLNVTGAFASVHVRDMTFLAGTTGGGDALTLTQTVGSIANSGNTALSDITSVVFRGSDGYAATNYWTDAIKVNGVSNINFNGIYAIGPGTVNGNGVSLNATSTNIGVVYNFQSCTFNYTTFGIFYNSYIQGVTVNQCNFTGGSTGIISPSGAVLTSQLSVTGSQFNNTSAGISLQANVPGTQISNNVFIVAGTGVVGVSIASPGLYGISANNFQGNVSTGSIGINLIGPSSSSGVLTGNMFFKMATGINLGSTTAGVNVQSNSYNSCTTPVNNAAGGSNTIGGGSQ